MRVPDGRRVRVDVDAVLDDLASGDAEIVSLETVRLIPDCCIAVSAVLIDDLRSPVGGSLTSLD
jgi:uncharacterized protein YlxW (UPF0749 family)